MLPLQFATCSSLGDEWALMPFSFLRRTSWIFVKNVRETATVKVENYVRFWMQNCWPFLYRDCQKDRTLLSFDKSRVSELGHWSLTSIRMIRHKLSQCACPYKMGYMFGNSQFSLELASSMHDFTPYILSFCLLLIMNSINVPIFRTWVIK